MSFLSELRRLNIERQKEWDPENKATLSFKGLEFAGEAGELASKIKKLARKTEFDMAGSNYDMTDIEEEVGDVLITLDLVCHKMGIDIEEVTRKKFNATSDKVGMKTKFTNDIKLEKDIINDYIDKWHDGEGQGLKLYEYLGMSLKEYEYFLLDEDHLEDISYARIFNLDIEEVIKNKNMKSNFEELCSYVKSLEPMIVRGKNFEYLGLLFGNEDVPESELLEVYYQVYGVNAPKPHSFTRGDESEFTVPLIKRTYAHDPIAEPYFRESENLYCVTYGGLKYFVYSNNGNNAKFWILDKLCFQEKDFPIQDFVKNAKYYITYEEQLSCLHIKRSFKKI